MTSKPYSSKQCRSLIITCRTHSRAGAYAGVSCWPRSINYRLSHLCLVFLHHVPCIRMANAVRPVFKSCILCSFTTTPQTSTPQVLLAAPCGPCTAATHRLHCLECMYNQGLYLVKQVRHRRMPPRGFQMQAQVLQRPLIAMYAVVGTAALLLDSHVGQMYKLVVQLC